MEEALLALFVIAVVVEVVVWVIVHLWWVILSVIGLWLFVRFVMVPWWEAQADQRRHARARRDITTIHDSTLRQMREAANAHVIEGKARDVR